MSAIPVADPPRDVLRRDEAAARAARVRDVRYDLALELTAGEGHYTGRTIVAFELLPGEGAVWLDHTASAGDPVVLVNGEPLADPQVGHRIVLPDGLPAGRVEVRVDYRHAYDSTGDGFHRFLDPEDATEYVYSNFQPFEAHRLFPCFDQPDLKACFRVTVDAPAHWSVVSATRATVEELPAGDRRHRFAETPPISSYLLPVIAGEWHSVHEERDGLSLGLYARRSMARFLEREAGELFEITRQGFACYAAMFDQPYAFGDKYDQLFVPEFNAGAMENVAAVTFHDSFLFRDPPTEPERLTRAEVVLHEL
ncbi:MAG: M1 family aminopeptidase, partial [Candidatus Limnocylindrales bacterium]